MRTHPANKYHLRELHQEIDLFDRKIAHSSSFEKFDSEDQRAEEIQKLQTKRDALVKVASDLVSKGIEYDPKDLPRSLKNQQGLSSGGGA